MLKAITAAGAAIALMSSAAFAETITFNQFSNGEQILADNIDAIATLVVDNQGGGPDVLIAYDTNGDGAPPDQNDPDLIQPIGNAFDVGAPSLAGAGFSFVSGNLFGNTGNVAIISENQQSMGTGAQGNPLFLQADDEAGGGTVDITLNGLFFFDSIDLFDIDDDATVTLTLADMVSTVSFSVSGFDTNNPTNLAVRVMSDVENLLISAIQISFNGISGAFDNIALRAVPIPGAFFLLLSGLAGLGFASRTGKRI